MAARSVQVPGGWLSVCEPCDVETWAATLAAAEKAGKAHDQAKHPQPAPVVEEVAALW